MRDHGLVTRLVAAALLAGLVTAVVGTLLVRSSARTALRAQVETQLIRAAERMATGVDDRVTSAVEAIELLATREAVAGLRPQAATELTVGRRVLRNVEQMILVDGDGRAVAAVAARTLLDTEDLPPDPAAVEAVRDAGVQVGLTADAEPLLEVVVPIEDPPGTVVGALTASFPIDIVAPRPVTRPFEIEGVASLVDSEGRTVVHPERDHVLRGDRIDLAPFRNGAHVRVVDREGQPTLIAVAPVPALGASVVIEQPEVVAIAPAGTTMWQLTAILVAVVAVTVVAVSFAGRGLLLPLGTLVEAVTRLGRGERSVRVTESGAGEVGTLAREFNRMADALEEHIEQLAASEERFHSILANTSSIISLKDLDGRYLQVNRRFAELFDVDQEAVVGRRDHELFPRDMADVYRRNDAAAIRTGAPVEVEELVLHDDGELHVYLSVKFPLRDGHGDVYGICGISTDVTEHRRAERYHRQLEEVRVRRQQALELNDSVVQGLAVSLYSLELGEEHHAQEAIENTLRAAKGVIDRLLAEDEERMVPGDLIRSEPARVTRPRGEG